MADDLLLLGTKIELRRSAGRILEEMDESPSYVSQVLDRDEEDNVMIAMPISEGHIIPLEVGSVLWAYFYTNKGIYRSRCKIISRGKEGNIFVAGITLLGELEKFQRREYYRLNCLIDVDVTVLNGQEVIQYSEKQEFDGELSGHKTQGVIVDISGGGLRFISDEKYEKNTYVFLTFKVPFLGGGIREFNILGRVVLSLNADNELSRYDNRVQFKVISKEVREDLIKFIFDEQRRMRKKERG